MALIVRFPADEKMALRLFAFEPERAEAEAQGNLPARTRKEDRIPYSPLRGASGDSRNPRSLAGRQKARQGFGRERDRRVAEKGRGMTIRPEDPEIAIE
jgi:hypothetical protein